MNVPSKIFFLLFYCFVYCDINFYGQNLVPNSSFEDTSQCPNGEYIDYAVGWNSYGVSPELYHPCASNQWSAPNTYIGYQFAATGIAFAGLCVYQRTGAIDNREFMGGILDQTLTIGQKYFVSFKANLPKKNPLVTNPNDCAVYACNKLGILFTTTTYSSTNHPPLNNFSHIYTDSVITDTLNWVTVAGSFVADSAYDHFIVGVFFDTNNVDTIRLFQPDCDVFAYYFIDDVCVSTDSMTCYNYIGINENQFKEYPFRIFPNPTEEYVAIDNEFGGQYNLTIYNVIGQELYKKENIVNDYEKIDVRDFGEGVLFIHIKTKNQSYIYKLLHT